MRTTWAILTALTIAGCNNSPPATDDASASLSVSVAAASGVRDGGQAVVTVEAVASGGGAGTGTVHLAADYGNLNNKADPILSA